MPPNATIVPFLSLLLRLFYPFTFYFPLVSLFLHISFTFPSRFLVFHSIFSSSMTFADIPPAWGVGSKQISSEYFCSTAVTYMRRPPPPPHPQHRFSLWSCSLYVHTCSYSYINQYLNGTYYHPYLAGDTANSHFSPPIMANSTPTPLMIWTERTKRL
jgi:hypothetical protein